MPAAPLLTPLLAPFKMGLVGGQRAMTPLAAVSIATVSNVVNGKASVALDVAERFGINNLNRVKPGIAEATRAVMRRVPDHVVVRNTTDSDVQLLMHLCIQCMIPSLC